MNMHKGGMVVSHREYIQDITSSTPFIGENFPLNPGINTTFPWLSQIADNFEEWIPEAIIFEYKTTSSNTVVNTNNSNPGLGTVVIATQYNSLNNDFGNKQQMENYENAVSVDPSRSVVHAIECAKGQTPLQPMYVRTGALPVTPGVSNDLRFYDHGKMTIATIGQQTNNFVIGELWVSYRIRFLKPRLQTGVGNNEQGVVDHFALIGNSVAPAGFGTMVPQNPFGSGTVWIPPREGSTLGGVLCGGAVPVASQDNVRFPPSLGGPKPFPAFNIVGGIVDPTQVASTARSYYFPPGITSGLFQVTYTGVYTTAGGAANQVVTAVSDTSGCVLENHLNTNVAVPGSVPTLSQQNNTVTGTTTTDMTVFFIRVLTNYAHFSMTRTAGMLAAVYADMTVQQLPEAFV